LADGISFNTLINAPLKTNTLTVQFLTPLTVENAAKTAILPYYLSDTNNIYRSEKELSLKLQQLYGANLSDGVMKFGDSQNIQITGSSINNKYAFDNEDVTGEIAKIIFDCFYNPYVKDNAFEEKIFALKKRELEDSILSEINDKRPYAFRRAGRIIFEGEAAALSNQGELADAEKLTSADVYNHYLDLIMTAEVDISFAGQSEDDAKAVLENVVYPAINSIKRNFTGFKKFAPSKLKSSPRRETEYLDIAQSKMVMGFKLNTIDKAPPAVMALLNAIIGGTPSSKLFLNVREKLSLCYYCSSNYNDPKGCLVIDSGIEGKNAHTAEAEILRQISLAKSGEITEDEMGNAKRQIINAARTINDSAPAMIAWYFSRNFSGAPESPEERIEKIKKITKDELVAAASALELDSVYLLTKEEK
jgi:predicted Zn-dependent peptidase